MPEIGDHKPNQGIEDKFPDTCDAFRDTTNEMFELFCDEKSMENGIHSFSFTRSDIVRSKILKFIISKLETYKKV